MPAVVLLKKIVDAFETQSDEYLSFVNVDTGQVETLPIELLSQAEEGDPDDDPDDDDPEWVLCKAVVSGGSWKRLPRKYDINDWEIMREFADDHPSEKISNELSNAISGSGAFRYFKDTVRRYRIEKEWFAFRAEALAQIGRKWCNEHGVECR